MCFHETGKIFLYFDLYCSRDLCHTKLSVGNIGKVKLNFTLQLPMKAERESRSIALLFL